MVGQWSKEDQRFLVTIPEFADLVVMSCTHGKTREAAMTYPSLVAKEVGHSAIQWTTDSTTTAI